MRKKLKPWQKTVITYVSFLLVLLLAAGAFLLLAVSPEEQYGIKSGIIAHSQSGENITEKVINSTENIGLLENENLKVSVSPDGNISVLNKKTKKIWSTAVADALQSNFSQGFAETHSLCSITYVNDKNAEAQWTAYEQSVQKKQMDIYKLSDGKIRFDFILGESSSDQLIPTGITKERFEEDILPKLDEEEQAFMKRQYLLYEADKLTVADNPDALYEKYPNLKNTPIYIAGNISSKVTKRKLTAVFDKIGYTAEDYDNDNKLTGFGASSVTFTYRICIDLELSGNDLVVNIPRDDIVFYTDHPLLRISLMKFLSSATSDASVLIPSGSGAIAEFKAGGNQVSYSGKIYGEDLTVNQKTLPYVMDADSSLSFPIFALRQGKDTITALIESGAATASINYNTTQGGMNCYYDFTVLQSDKAYIDEKNNVIQCGNDILSEDISVRYRFSDCNKKDKNEAVFSAISRDYREYLKEKGTLTTQKKVSDNPKLLLDLLGSINIKKDMLGLFPVNTGLVMTDAEMADGMVDWFYKKFESDISVKLSGWNKGGLYRQAAGKISFSGDLGGKKGYENLYESLNKKGINLYTSAEHITFLEPSLFDGYSNKNTAMFVDGSSAVLGIYSAVEGGNFSEGSINIISPAKYTAIAEDYIKDDIKTLSVGNLANSLNTDYGSPYFDRTRTQAQVIKTLDIYKKNSVSLTAEDANAYALPYLESIENIPVNSGNNSIFKQSFPLKQIVLHGNIDYTTEADFSVTETKETVLNAIRFGSGLKATLSYQNSNYSFPSYYSYFYSTDYMNNRDKIAEYHTLINEALQGLGKVEIESYQSEGEISKTVYADGTVIYVNSGDKAVTFDTHKIEAMSYLRIINLTK